MELQKKVITLQQERDHLEEKLMRGAPISVTAEVERRQNLELKVGLASGASSDRQGSSSESRPNHVAIFPTFVCGFVNVVFCRCVIQTMDPFPHVCLWFRENRVSSLCNPNHGAISPRLFVAS